MNVHSSESSSYSHRVKEELKGYLENYMDLHGIKFRGKGRGSFQCPNNLFHKNGDRNFSGAFDVSSSNRVWYCHGCKMGGSIYEMANFIEGLPIGSDEQFWSVTIPRIANEVGFPINEEQYFKSKGGSSSGPSTRLSIDDMASIRNVIQQRSDWSKINETFNRNYPDDVKKQISERFEVFFPQKGDFSFLPDIETDPPTKHPFNDDAVITDGMMVYPIYSRYGQLLGFQGRASVELEAAGTRKYRYTPLLNPDENMGVFNLHQARKSITETGSVFLFEAQFDCMVACCQGLNNSIAVGTSKNLDKVIAVLKQLGTHEAIICMDPDKAGIESAIKCYKQLIEAGISSSIFVLPDNIDADEFITRNGIVEFTDPTKRTGLIEFLITKDYGHLSNQSLSLPTRYTIALGYIIENSRNVGIATQYAELLAKKFSIKSQEDVHYDIMREMGLKKDPIITRCNDLIQGEINSIIQEIDLDKKMMSLEGLNHKMIEVYGTYLSSAESEDNQELQELLSQGDESDRGRIFTGINSLDDCFRLYPGTLAIIGGRPSVGKSTAIRFLCDTIQKANEDVFILHLSLDDMVRETVDGILCNIANIPNSVMETNRFSPDQRERLEEAQDLFRRQWWKQTYYVCGQKKVSSIADAHALIRRIQIRHPNKRIIMITDNLMNLPEVAKNQSKDKRIVVETAINELHILGQTMDVANLTIVELTKGGPYRPTTAMLKETGTLEYRARVILMLHNDLKANRMSKIFWVNDNGEKLPVLEIDNAKFKVGAPNKISFLKMDPAYNRLVEASESEATRWNRIVVAEGIKKSDNDQSSGTDEEQREML